MCWRAFSNSAASHWFYIQKRTFWLPIGHVRQGSWSPLVQKTTFLFPSHAALRALLRWRLLAIDANAPSACVTRCFACFPACFPTSSCSNGHDEGQRAFCPGHRSLVPPAGLQEPPLALTHLFPWCRPGQGPSARTNRCPELPGLLLTSCPGLTLWGWVTSPSGS